MEAKPKRWTKKDIKTLQQQLMSFVLYNERYYPKDRIRAFIEQNRARIVTDGLTSFRSMIAERSKQNKDTAEHYKSHFGDKEMHERFIRLHAECESDLKKIDALIARVQTEGLPPEVANHMPDR
jgi:hypothetical protein